MSKPEPKEKPVASDPVDPKHVLDLSKHVFYKTYFGRVLVALMVMAISNVMLCAGFVWAKNQKVDRQYFATEQGRLTRILPMNEPHLTGSNLLTWAQTCVTQSNTYDFVNYRAQFMADRPCFTSEGWTQFESAMESAGTLKTVQNERLVTTAVADGAPVVNQEGLYNGTYAWQIQLPVTVTYQGGQAGRNTVNQKLLVKLLVTNIPTYASKEGVGIAQYVATER